MKKLLAMSMTLFWAGCSHSHTLFSEETWVGLRSDGFPNWSIVSEIPDGLRLASHRPSGARSYDGMPLCYVRVAALVIPPKCYDAAHGDAGYYVDQFQSQARASNSNLALRQRVACGHEGHQIDELDTIIFRLPEDGSAVFLSESIDKAHNGKGYVFAMKPLKIGTDDCSVMYVMQGVDQWTPAARASAAWHAGTQVKLACGQSYAEWATMTAGDNHVLAIVSLERLTTGEPWFNPAKEKTPETAPAKIACGPASIPH